MEKKLSEVIMELQAILEEHGDLPVKYFHPRGSCEDYNSPGVGFLRKLAGREFKKRVWEAGDKPELKSTKIVII
jgi:hypothetical protein